MADETFECSEFDCCECGRHIVVISGPVPDLPFCGACLFVPGWYRNPDLIQHIDPEYTRDPTAP
jgi:hypothetical protein